MKTILQQNREVLKRWDNDEIDWSVELGGLGPGYEQAIQATAFEILRDNLKSKIPTKEEYGDWAKSTLERTDEAVGGHSGGTWGQAKWLGYKLLSEGYDNFISRARKDVPDRLIQVSKHFPQKKLKASRNPESFCTYYGHECKCLEKKKELSK
jgi:hypothetical protein